MIEIKDVSFTYNQAEAPSLSHVSLSIREGECVLLCGKSGCGKNDHDPPAEWHDP